MLEFYESLGMTPTFIDMGEPIPGDLSDFERIEDVLQDLINNKLHQHYKDKKHVMVHFYFSGHGYQDSEENV